MEEDLKKDYIRKATKPVGIFQFITISMMAVSPFIWIWHSWTYAWKTFITGLILTIFAWLIFEVVKKIAQEAWDKSFKK